jgi:hypothetical protein
VHRHTTYFAVIPNLNAQCFELTHLRIDENRLQIAREGYAGIVYDWDRATVEIRPATSQAQ